MKLPSAIFERPDPIGVRVGVVTAITPDLLVSLNGGEIRNPGTLQSYTPVVGDNVCLIRKGNSWLVLGGL